MNPIVAATVVGILTTLGRWARGKGLEIDIVVGVVILAVCLALIEQANTKLAQAFGALAVIGVAIAHAPVVLDATGLTKETNE